MPLEWLKKKYKQLDGRIPIEEVNPYANLRYDSYVQLIDLNYNNPENLREISTGIGLNENLNDAKKETLYKYIDKYLSRRWV